MWWTALLDLLFRWLLAILLPALSLGAAGCSPQLILRDARDLSVLPLNYKPSTTNVDVEVDRKPAGSENRPNP